MLVGFPTSDAKITQLALRLVTVCCALLLPQQLHSVRQEGQTNRAVCPIVLYELLDHQHREVCENTWNYCTVDQMPFECCRKGLSLVFYPCHSTLSSETPLLILHEIHRWLEGKGKGEVRFLLPLKKCSVPAEMIALAICSGAWAAGAQHTHLWVQDGESKREAKPIFNQGRSGSLSLLGLV